LIFEILIMRYQVPQFIDVEDKVIGPLTVKQFIYLAGGAGLSVLLYTFLPRIIAIPVILVILPLALSLAFYRINNKPFIHFLESVFYYYLKGNLYIWKRENKKVQSKNEVGMPVHQMLVPKLSDSKLKDLTWSLDVNENLNKVTEKEEKNPE